MSTVQRLHDRSLPVTVGREKLMEQGAQASHLPDRFTRCSIHTLNILTLTTHLEFTGKHNWTTNWKHTLRAQNMYFCPRGYTLKIDIGYSSSRYVNILGKSLSLSPKSFSHPLQMKNLHNAWRVIDDIVGLMVSNTLFHF